jgi:CDP-glycerol glycerophosphotransferase
MAIRIGERNTTGAIPAAGHDSNRRRKVVYSSFDGRYSDNPRAIYEALVRSGASDEHVWLCNPQHAHGFPASAPTVRIDSEAARRALEDADLVVANTHIEQDWVKKPGAVYLQTWHGTPLKRIHYDVLYAPPGRLTELDRDVARWDLMLSPNAASTNRLRDAFGFSGPVHETGYPRNDVLTSPMAAAVRARVRASLGLSDDTTAVLYTPTWRDDEFFAEGAPTARMALDVDAFVTELGENHQLLPRLHYMMTERESVLPATGVTSVSRYPDVHELYLAADVMVTDYSSTMFDFAVTGKPIIFYTYDLPQYRDAIRGFYFDLEPVAPGPMVDTTAGVVAALRDLPGLRSRFADRYAGFQETFCLLDDGRATERVLDLVDRAVEAAAVGSGRDGHVLSETLLELR